MESSPVKSSRYILWVVEDYCQDCEVLDSAGSRPYDDLNGEIIRIETFGLLHDQNSMNDDDLLFCIDPARLFLVLNHNALDN